MSAATKQKLSRMGEILMAITGPFTSRKLWASVISVLILQSLFWTSVFYLYSFTEQWRAEIFFKMFTQTNWGITGIVLGYLGLQTVASGWTNATTSAVTTTIQSVLNKKKETVQSTSKEAAPDK